MTWHAPPEILAAWVAGEAHENAAAAVEAHLVACAPCRDRVSLLDGDTDLRAVWTRVADEVEAGGTGILETVMRALRLPSEDAIVLRAAPAFTGAWAVAVAVVVSLAVAAAMVNPTRMLSLYLLLAPLVPVAGVAAGYGATADPTYELAVSAPYSKVRILLLRGSAILLASVPVTCAVGFLLDPWWVAVAWLGPGLTSVLLVLASLTWVGPVRAAGSVAALWLAACTIAMVRQEQLLVVGHVAMVIFAAVSVVALVVFSNNARLLSVAPRVGGL